MEWENEWPIGGWPAMSVREPQTRFTKCILKPPKLGFLADTCWSEKVQSEMIDGELVHVDKARRPSQRRDMEAQEIPIWWTLPVI